VPEPVSRTLHIQVAKVVTAHAASVGDTLLGVPLLCSAGAHCLEQSIKSRHTPGSMPSWAFLKNHVSQEVPIFGEFMRGCVVAGTSQYSYILP